MHHPDCPCPPGYFNSKTGFCRCACHLQDNTDPHHEPCGLPRQRNSPSILQHDYLSRLDHEATAQAGQPSPSTSLQVAAQAGQPSPSTSFPEAANADSGSSSENETDNVEDETTPIIPSAHYTKVIIQPEKEIEKEKESTFKEDFDSKPLASRYSSSQESLNSSNMDTDEMTDLQRQMVNLQQQMCRQLEAAQASLQLPAVAESTVTKHIPFHGRENENVDRWLQRFTLYLANRKIDPGSNQAAIQLALHLAGPAESFYYNLPSTVQASYEALKDALRERFSPAHRHLRLRQALSTRRQGPTESIENVFADLNEKFSCLYLRDEDMLSYLIQGLRADIQADVLKKEPKTYAEAEDAARLIYSIQQSLTQSREEDISRIVQNANRVSPSTTELETNRIARIESDLRSLITPAGPPTTSQPCAFTECIG